MCRIGIVSFLPNKEALRGVDVAFRHLAKDLNRIPYCASFGVSCAGHFRYTWYAGRTEPDKSMFNLRLRGNLSFIVEPSKPHIQKLLELIEGIVAEVPEAKIEVVDHLFGPPSGTLQVWKISYTPLIKKLQEDHYNVKTEKDKSLWDRGRKEQRRSRKFWKKLGDAVSHYCYLYHFRKFDLDARVAEIGETWPKNS